MAEYTASTFPWLATLERAATAETLRHGLLERHLAFAPDRLREVTVVGAADEGRRLVGLCDDRGIVVRAVVDDDPRKLGARVGGRCRSGSYESASRAQAVVIQPDGKIVVAGLGAGYDFGVARYTVRGLLDRTFGDGGLVSTDFGSG